MAGQGQAEVHTATIPVDHSQFTIFDVFGDDTYAGLDIPRDPAWLFSAGRGGALFPTSDRALSPEVTLEIWSEAPESRVPRAARLLIFTNGISALGADDATEQVFHTPNGRVMIDCITASPRATRPSHCQVRATTTSARNGSNPATSPKTAIPTSFK
ncbi:hypothetical protein [Amycolatopsis sp. NPDC004378]